MYEKMWYDLMTFLKQNEVHNGKLKTWQSHEIISVMVCMERNHRKAEYKESERLYQEELNYEAKLIEEELNGRHKETV